VFTIYQCGNCFRLTGTVWKSGGTNLCRPCFGSIRGEFGTNYPEGDRSIRFVKADGSFIDVDPSGLTVTNKNTGEVVDFGDTSTRKFRFAKNAR
jgi:hypothetical protein